MVEVTAEGIAIHEELLAAISLAVEAALAAHKMAAKVSVLVIDDEAMRAINKEQRGIDKPTDVLSFPAWQGEEAKAPPDGFAGDLAVCYETAMRQAEEYGHSLRRELAFLAVHGTLHLLGYDHQDKEGETEMFEAQETILKEMGLYR